MTNESGDLVMIFNGEIYNHEELRSLCEGRGHRFGSRMDGEVILHLWEDEGPSGLARLNGIFALAIGRPRTGEMWLARDSFGVKPLFYRLNQGGLSFASEPAAMEHLGRDGNSDALDELALAQFLTFLWIPDPLTSRKAVRSLLPGHYLAWDPSGNVLIQPYGTPLWPETQPDPIGTAGALERLQVQLQDAVDRQLMSDVPLGLMVSGGVDSTLLWWASRGKLDGVYSIEWPAGASDENLHEDAQAVRTLERSFEESVSFLEGERRPLGFPASGDLFADQAYQLTKQIASRARTDGVKVLLSGHGGDEVMGGYRRHAVAHSLLTPKPKAALARFAAAPIPRLAGLKGEYLQRVRRAVMQPDPFDAYMELCTYSTSAQRARALDADERDVSDEAVRARHREVWESLPPTLSMLRKAMALDTTVYLPGLGLSYMDRAGMSQGIEIRVPWLDEDLFRWSLTLPDQLLVRRMSTKVLPRKLVGRLFGPDIAKRPKRGFAAPVAAPSAGFPGAGRGFRQEAIYSEALRLLKEFRTRDQQHGLRNSEAVPEG
jgi:asparagine synthase (glutamine-hydrolysing)